MKKIIGLLSITLTLIAIGCSSDDGGTTPPEEEINFDRAPLLINWADNIIIPGYVDFSDHVSSLSQSVSAFNNTPTVDNLNALRTSWLEAYTTWQRISMFESGPAEVVGLRLNVNIYPTNVGLIEDNIASGSYNLDLPSNRAAKGFPALDYLLYGLGDNEEAIVAKYVNNEGEVYRNYLVALVNDMESLTNQVKNEWQNGYRDTFVANAGSSATASVDKLVNDYIFYFEKHLRAGKMGIPLGVFSGNVLPENIEAVYNGAISKQLFIEGLNAFQDFFNGKSYTTGLEGASLKTYLNALNTVKDGTNLSVVLNNQINTARSSVQGLQSFKLELENIPPTQMLLAYDEVQKIVPLLKVDMVSAMSISIDFVDADGD
ncbi:MAG: imelysin family protein [Bacteroidota bacterium]